MAEKRKTYHIFKRRDDSGNIFELECLVEKAKGVVTIEILEEHIREALRRDGQADSQNCGGGVCVVTGHKNRFPHPVSVLVDWWRNRLYIYTGTKNKVPRCTVYAHYDNIEALFDGTEKALERLINRIKRKGSIPINLFPVTKGYHSKTGRKTNPPGPGAGGSGRKRPPRGGDLRALNFMRARGLLPIPQEVEIKS